MKNILLILVGGTICSASGDNGTLSVTEKAGITLKENFLKSSSPYRDKVNMDLTENLFILSENMTVDKWNLIIGTYRKYTENRSYDGIIFAHGTDTLAYSSSLFGLLLAGTSVPVFFVSANKPLSSCNSNGNENFRCAVELICRGISPNVYVPYKNISDGKMYLHLGTRLRQCENYSEDFKSAGAFDITDISEENCGEIFKAIAEKYPQNLKKPLLNISDSITLRNCVLKFDPYVGINYDAYDYGKFSAVLHGSYHSCTACAEKTEKSDNYSENSVLYMIDRCGEQTPKTDVYFSPAKLSGDIYETANIIGHHKSENGHHPKLLYGYTPEAAYCKLLLAYSVFGDKKEREDFINSECNFEVIEK